MSPSDVVGVLRAVDAEIAAGMAVAGFISYEAAAGIDAAFCVYEAGAFPLVWFGVYREPQMLAELPEVPDNVVVSESVASVDAADYADSIERIKSYIAAGDTYQVNYTIRLRHAFSGDAYAFFRRLYYAQETDYAAYVDIGDYAVCSVSPELFFELRGSDIRMKPMKGTARRGLTLEDDRRQAGMLRECGKNRAENVMIVDMVRNDLGRIAEPGSVRVASLFDVERYPAVWQMVSTVEARTSAGLSELMGALFPCASITGAPKVRTMEIIRELESSPRGIYTGAIGYWLPERQACFNVAIRTAVVDRKSAGMEYGVGGGIVWDSVEEHEFDECLAKAEVLRSRPYVFELLETLLWRPRQGFELLERHLERMSKSAEYFGYVFERDDIVEMLDKAVALESEALRVRVLLARDGAARVESYPLDMRDDGRVRCVALMPDSVRSDDVFLYHKTTRREVYRTAAEAFPDADDVLLMNERGEVTESTVANLIVETGGVSYTPPLSSGLLPGTMRAELLERGEISERVIMPDDLAAADALWLINSVRGRMRVYLSEIPDAKNCR